MRQQIVSQFIRSAHDMVAVSPAFQWTVAHPPIRLDYGTRQYRCLDRRDKAITRCVWNARKANPANSRAVNLGRDQHQSLVLCPSSMFPCSWTTNVCFVHLYRSRKPISSRTNHGAPHLVKPCPSSTIGGQSQNPLQTQCAGADLLAGYVPHCTEPKAQWLARVLEYRSRSQRDLMSTTGAHQKVALRGPDFHATASRADDAFRPTNSHQICTACIFGTEQRIEFRWGFGVIVHARTLPVVLTGVKGIPTYNYSLWVFP